jgi:hypothetical protein
MFPFLVECILPFLLDFGSSWLSNPNIGTHRLCARENTHEMPPNRWSRKELSAEDSSQAAGAQPLKTTQTTTQPQTSTKPCIAAVETRRLEEPPQQPATQAEMLAMNTSTPNIQQPTQHQETEAQEDQ